MPPASSSKKKFSMKSFAQPKTQTAPDPEALQRLMQKTEVDGKGPRLDNRLRGRRQATDRDSFSLARRRVGTRGRAEHS